VVALTPTLPLVLAGAPELRRQEMELLAAAAAQRKPPPLKSEEGVPSKTARGGAMLRGSLAYKVNGPLEFSSIALSVRVLHVRSRGTMQRWRPREPWMHALTH
jgi:hypothetical protein